MMDIFQVKLKKANAQTRLLEFDAWQTWDELCSKIVELFHIPHNQVIITFRNPQGDFINITNDGELLQLYASLRESCKYIKFVVQDSQAVDGDSIHTMSHIILLPFRSYSQRNVVNGLEFVRYMQKW